MNAMLICEELFLLLTKDSGKPESRMTYPVYGLTGALLTDLLLAGRISLTEERSPRIYIINSGPTGHPVLDWALTVLPAKDGKRFSSVVSWGKLNPTRHIAASLETTGGRPALASLPPRGPAANRRPSSPSGPTFTITRSRCGTRSPKKAYAQTHTQTKAI